MPLSMNIIKVGLPPTMAQDDKISLYAEFQKSLPIFATKIGRVNQIKEIERKRKIDNLIIICRKIKEMNDDYSD